jgi:SAM-dependent methyltransferase
MSVDRYLEVLPSSPVELDFRWYEDIRAELLLRAVRSRSLVLDVGCGRGEVLLGLSGMIECGTGIDLSHEETETASRRARERGVTNLTFIRADAGALPFGENSYDTVLCLGDVLSCGNLYSRWEKALQEMRRVLRPGGGSAFHCMNWDWEYRSSPHWVFFQRGKDSGYQFTRDERSADGVETARDYAVVAGTPLAEWIASKEWPAGSGDYQTALTVAEKEPLPEAWIRYTGTSRHRNFTADGLAQALRWSGFGEVWVTAFGATYDIASTAGVLGEVEPVRRRLAQAEAEVVWQQRQGSGPWLFAAAQKV